MLNEPLSQVDFIEYNSKITPSTASFRRIDMYASVSLRFWSAPGVRYLHELLWSVPPLTLSLADTRSVLKCGRVDAWTENLRSSREDGIDQTFGRSVGYEPAFFPPW
jgi:hypothetical protein